MATDRSQNEPQPVPTGVAGLDRLLEGGLLPGACLVVEGVPGAGKTTLGIQFILEGIANHDEPGLIVSFEELPDEIYRDAASYGWDLPALELEGKLRVVCTSPEVFQEETRAAEGLLDSLVEEIQPRRALVDSITQMGHITPDPFARRRMVYSLRNGLKRHGLTTILTKEVESTDGYEVPFEEYLADAVVRLGYRLVPESGERVREIEVIKTRARPHVSGRHLAALGPGGMRVFPDLLSRARDVPEPEEEAGELTFLSTGSEGLDAMLRGGIVKGTTTILAGSTGVGKTVLGLQYLFAGAMSGESGLLVAFEQTPGEIRRIASSLGMPVDLLGPDGPIRVAHERPTRAPLGYLVDWLKRMLETDRPSRVVVDAISSLAKLPGAPGRVRSDLAGLVALLRDSPATCIACDETAGIVGEFEITGGSMISSLADNIITMRYVELGSEMRRAVSILKARYVDHDKEIREYVIQRGGIALWDKFEVSTGLMRGAPVRPEKRVDDFF